MKILEYMRTHGNRITTAEAADNLRIMSFTKRMSELREKGYLISDETVHFVNADGVHGHYKVYHLDEVV